MRKTRILWLPVLASSLMAANLDEIRAALVNRVEEGKRAVGIVAGTVDAAGRHVESYGRVSRETDQKPDGDTIFEIGSMTKVFTSLVLADMIERGEVKPDDPVARYLPENAGVPARGGKQITLLDLSMQISGLPRLPSNLAPADPLDPYADYTGERLLDFLAGYKLQRDIGAKYEYSNLGVGLLGFALARRAGMSYEDMVRRRILEPLGMTSTAITLSPEQKKRLATGYNVGLEPAEPWNFDALAGAGAIRSTANDLLKFLAANMGLIDTPLKAAMARMRSVHRETGLPGLEIMMGWHVWHKYGTDIVWHDGGTGGFRSWAGFDPARKTGVVVLCNTFLAMDDIGLHTLENRWPIATFSPPKQRAEIALSPDAAARVSGDYQFAPGVLLTVTREGARMFAQLTGQPPVEIYAESESEFFLKAVDAQLTFKLDRSGKVTAVVLHQNGINQTAIRK